MSFWRRLLHALRWIFKPDVGPRTFHLDALDGDLNLTIKRLAENEQRSEREIVAEMLENAIVRRQVAEANLRKWRELTPREQQVVGLACLEMTNGEIAERLVISEETVKTHMRNVLAKFNMHSKIELRQALADWDFSAYLDAKL